MSITKADLTRTRVQGWIKVGDRVTPIYDMSSARGPDDNGKCPGGLGATCGFSTAQLESRSLENDNLTWTNTRLDVLSTSVKSINSDVQSMKRDLQLLLHRVGRSEEQAVNDLNGSDSEVKLFGHGAKLYQNDPEAKQWKERGTGEIKIMKNTQRGTFRVLMRRERVHTTCANHHITKDMKLAPLHTSETAWCWLAQNCSEVGSREEQFAVRFKHKEQAQRFKDVFEECVVKAGEDTTKSDEALAVNPPGKEQQPQSLAEQFEHKARNWDCEACYVRNKAGTKNCAACETLKPVDTDTLEPDDTADEQEASSSMAPALMKFETGFVFEGVAHGVQGTIGKQSDGTVTSYRPPLDGFKFDGFGTKPETHTTGGFEVGGLSFDSTSFRTPIGAHVKDIPESGATSVKADKNGNPERELRERRRRARGYKAVDNLSYSATSKHVQSGFSFGSVTQCDSNKPSMFTAEPPKLIGSGGPTQPVFAGPRSVSDETTSKTEPLKLSANSACSDDVTIIREEPVPDELIKEARKWMLPDAFYLYKTRRACKGCIGCRSEDFDFATIGGQKPQSKPHKVSDKPSQPLAQLPEVVDLATGDERHETIFSHRAKLYRYDKNQWKERAVGDMKILKNPENGRCRLIMRREHVAKVACNHYVTADMILQPLQTSETAWCWFAIDHAETTPNEEQFALRFKTIEMAALFKEKFDECKHMIVAAKVSAQSKSEPAETSSNASAHIGSSGTSSKTEDEEDTVDEVAILFSKRATLSALNHNGQPQTLGMGELQVIYDEDVCGARLQMMSDNEPHMFCNHIICRRYRLTSFEDKKMCEWSAKDFSTDEPVKRTFRAQFASKNAVGEFAETFDQGLTWANESEIDEVSEETSICPRSTHELTTLT